MLKIEILTLKIKKVCAQWFDCKKSEDQLFIVFLQYSDSTRHRSMSEISMTC